ncbi:MAG: hypothetical protein ABFD09_00585 [Proteiniphilum sp.]
MKARRRIRKKIPVLVLVSLFAISCSGSEIIPLQKEETGASDTVDLSTWSAALGVNYNEQLQFIDFNDLKRTKTRWVRGFIDFFQLYDSTKVLLEDEKILNYLSLHKEGYRTILNIKWNFRERDESLPVEDSADFNAYMIFLNKLLEQVWYSTDLLVIGNEPFIETKIAERDHRLVNFYKAVTKSVMKFRDVHPDRYIPVFVGAFNNLYEVTWQTAAVNDLLSFVEKEPGIAGIDLHIHHAEMEHIPAALNFVSDKIRENQKILVTEFSLMKHWKSHLLDAVSEPFALAWHIDLTWKNYQYIDFALKNPRPKNEWVAFLQNSPWFESRKNYLQEAYTLMIGNPRFLVATYAIRQSFPYNQDFKSTNDPWVLNGLFANRTIVQDTLLKQSQFNYSFIDNFIEFQK